METAYYKFTKTGESDVEGTFTTEEARKRYRNGWLVYILFGGFWFPVTGRGAL